MADDLFRLMSLLSHELGAPLGVMRGYLRMLEQAGDTLAEQHRRAVAAALRASEHAVALLDQASTLAHLHLGDIQLDPRPVPLPSLLNAAVQAVELPDESDVTLDVRPVPSVRVKVDEPRMRTAVAALIAAVVRAQTTTVTVEVSAEQRRLGNLPAVRICIGTRTVSRLTETELDATRGGSGLQVAIAAALVAAHRGRIRELRIGDRHTGVVVWLPLAR